MKAIKLLKGFQSSLGSSKESLFNDEDSIDLWDRIDEALLELKGVIPSNTCETCSKWKQHSGSIFGVCADGNRCHFSDEDTVYTFGCNDYRKKDTQ